MATIQVVIDDELLQRLDHQLRGRTNTRSAFVRSAIERELNRAEIARLEEEHRQAYLDVPVTPEEEAELRRWQKIQDWGEPWEPDLAAR